ncbi:cardiolipin synthase [Snodgrassella sp. CFCC 13594]|uniref:cardiolipin synthase n=1 Tax=Snodgrassella sp. CFCC 13594 TaxID=1775559 RepID=UPI000833AC9C|nr:cardiolipin synthase [Snodgrassella sp. CFCC 13594]
MPFHIPWGEILLVVHVSIVVGLMIRVLYHQRDIGVSVAWLVILFAFPFAGALAYALVGEPRLGNDRLRRRDEMTAFYHAFSDSNLIDINHNVSHELDERYHGISLIAADKTGLVATEGNHLQLLDHDAAIVAAMRHDIQQAQSSCLLAFYIIDVQGMIEGLMMDVMAAAERGVVCSILADEVGSLGFWRSEWPQKLRQVGIVVTPALPVGLLRTLFVRADLRYHRKLLVVDQQIGYTGSFNLVDPCYFKQDAGVGQWVDVMMRCEGSMVQAMAAVCAVDIAVENEPNLQQVQGWLDRYGAEALPRPRSVAIADRGIIAQVVPSSPEPGNHAIYATIISAIHSATRRIIITTPYFVPDDALLLALTTAAERGVNVTLVVPKHVDSKLVKYASRAYYPHLLKAGVNIAQFTGGLLHAKTLTVDTHYTLFGTVNMDMRSFYLNLEISLQIFDEKTTKQVVALQNQYLQQCTYIELKAWQARAKWWGLVENTVRLFSPLL